MYIYIIYILLIANIYTTQAEHRAEQSSVEAPDGQKTRGCIEGEEADRRRYHPSSDPTSYADFGAATHPGVGGGTHRRRATFKRCYVFVGGVRLGVWGAVLVVCVCVARVLFFVGVCVSNQRYHYREDASSMVTAGATANTTEGNSRASRESGLLCSHSHGESIGLCVRRLALLRRGWACCGLGWSRTCGRLCSKARPPCWRRRARSTRYSGR